MILFERYCRLRRNFRGRSFWARGYYVNIVGLDDKKVRNYIKNQQEHDSIKDRYGTDFGKDPFRGSSIAHPYRAIIKPPAMPVVMTPLFSVSGFQFFRQNRILQLYLLMAFITAYSQNKSSIE